MKIFITGINSFVGKELTKILKKKKIKFTGCDINKKNNFFNCDIRSKKISNIIPTNSIVVHLFAHWLMKEYALKIKEKLMILT